MTAAARTACNVHGEFTHARFRPKSGIRLVQLGSYIQFRTSLKCRMQPADAKTKLASSGPLEPLFLRMPTVLRMTGLGRTTIYRLMADQQFPHPVKLGPRAVAWRRVDLDRWSEGRPTAAQ